MQQVPTTVLGSAVAVVIAAVSVYMLRKKWRQMESKLQKLEESLATSAEKCASERQGRIRAQQALRKALVQPKPDSMSGKTFYPMTPIGTVESCFSTRNGTPRQPLLVPLARACLVFDPTRVPLGSLEGLEQYSHCWIIFVFHLNTDLDKLWKDPSKSRLKAKVRVPRLEGGRMGVFATRSPHRPLPIGLTVAKVEAVQSHMVLLSGVDLVDGTPVLDIKPYLPYCDSIQDATVPDWIMADNLLAVSSIKYSDSFASELSCCWESMRNDTLYESLDEIERLIQQVLSWDIRSSSQRNRPHKSSRMLENSERPDMTSDLVKQEDLHRVLDQGSEDVIATSDPKVVYHLALEGLAISYKIDCEGHVIVEGVQLNPRPRVSKGNKRRCSYSASWA